MNGQIPKNSSLVRGAKVLPYAILLFVILVLYVMTLCPFSFPVSSADFLARHAGLNPYDVPALHPIWTLVIGWFKQSPDLFAICANLFNLPLVVASLALLAYVVSHLPQYCTQGDPASELLADKAQRLAGWAGVAFLAISAPCWLLATRAHPSGIGLFLVTLVGALVTRLAYRPSWHVIIWASFLSGVLLVESPSMAPLVPCCWAAIAMVMWRQHRLGPGRICVVMLSAGAGALVLAFILSGTADSSDWIARFGQSDSEKLKYFYASYIVTAKAALPRVGWLIVLAFTVIPWLFVIVLPASLNRFADTELSIVHVVLLVLGLLLSVNMFISPWQLVEFRAIIVLPYLLAAMWFGYVVGAVYLGIHSSPYSESPWKRHVRGLFRVAYLPLVSCVLLVSAWRNAALVDSDHGRLAYEAVRHTVAQLPDASIVLSNGALDPVFHVVAFQTGKELHCVNLANERLNGYRSYVAGLIEEPRLQMLANIGIMPWLDEWISRGDAASHLAVVEYSDLWHRYGFEAVPQGMVYRALRRGNALHPNELFDQQVSLWDTSVDLNRNIHSSPVPLNRLNRWLMGYMSKMANDSGVLLEDYHLSDLARQAYEHSLRLNSNNVSSKLNLVSVARHRKDDDAEKLQSDLEAYLADLPSKLRVWSLAQSHGVVRHPEAYTQLGWLWAASGRPEQAVHTLEKASELGHLDPASRMYLAALYADEGRERDSKRQLAVVLSEKPDDVSALLGMARIAMRSEDFERSGVYVRKALDVDPENLLAQTDLAMLAMLEGDFVASSSLVARVGLKTTRNEHIISLEAMLALKQNNMALYESCIEELQRVDTGMLSTGLAVASLLLAGNQITEAEQHVRQLHSRWPGSIAIKEYLLSLEVRGANQEKAEELARDILRIQPRNAMANFVLGSVLYARGDVKNAVEALRASLRAKPSPEALNSLGWMLLEQGNAKEAARRAGDALRMNMQHAAAWDTLGVALLRLGKLAKAEIALQKAIAYNPGRKDYVLHFAEVRSKRGNTSEALALLDSILEGSVELPESVREEAIALASQIEQISTYR